MRIINFVAGIEKLISRIKKCIDLKEVSLDNWLQLNHPELWRRGYARVLKFCFTTVVISFPSLYIVINLFLFLVDKNIIQDDGGTIFIFVLLPFFILFALLRGVFILFEKDKQIIERSKYSFLDFNFIYTRKSDVYILGINLSLVVLSHLYVIALYVLVFASLALITPKNEKAKNNSPRISLEEDIQKIAQGEYYYLYTSKSISADSALEIIEDSIIQKLDTSIKNQLKHHYVRSCIHNIDLADSIQIIKQYYTVLYPELPNSQNGFPSLRKNYSEIITTLNRRYVKVDSEYVQVDSEMFSKILKMMAGIYFLILAWGLSYFYFKDINGEGYQLKLPIFWSWLKRALCRSLIGMVYSLMIIVVCYLLVFILKTLEHLGPKTSEECFNYLYLALKLWWKLLINSGVILFYVIGPVFLVLYFMLFPRWKYQTYQFYFAPTSKPSLDLDVKVKVKSLPLVPLNNIKKLDNFLQKYVTEFWRINLLKLLNILVKNTFYTTIITFLISIIISLLRNAGIISLLVSRILIGNIFTLMYIISLAVFLVFPFLLHKELKLSYKGWMEDIHFSFNWKNERIFAVAVLLFCYIPLLNIDLVKNVMYKTCITFSGEKLDKDTFYFYAVSSLKQDRPYFKYDMTTELIEAEYYFRKTYDRIDDRIFIDDLSRVLSSKIDSVLHKFASKKRISNVIAGFDFKDSLKSITNYNYFLTGKLVKMSADSTGLISYRKNFDQIVMKKILSEIKQSDKKSWDMMNSVLCFYCFIVFLIASFIYFIDVAKKGFKINFLNKSYFLKVRLYPNWLLFVIATSVFLIMLFVDGMFFFCLILFYLIFYPKIKYEIYKYNFTPN